METTTPIQYLPLPNEALFNILMNLSYNDVINYCSVNTSAAIVCKDPVFWQEKASHDFDISSREFKNSNLEPQLRYIEFLTKIGKDVFPVLKILSVSILAYIERHLRIIFH